ncbi:amino acid transporter, putative [Entamoeba invadens IP1]|uniref:Amino acid transporter, putative n=1 Tax=Entamoeba invadens IP1 TaxID=370355 RepID=A0A0A1U6E9_ENTIV|nr:amino acid transporter, putative [Entamoeba invadens IP1]ELP89875.1 amino acid transporter, putative [Entamoeba invadens IP1]|eukprot:XP_004256646.1 amino acid transporter, putative [Entamoeba invadens IP1]
MTKAVIRSKLDDDTLSRTLEKGEFEAYPERDFEDGIHDYISEVENVDLDIDIETTIRTSQDDKMNEIENEVIRESCDDIVYKGNLPNKVRKREDDQNDDHSNGHSAEDKDTKESTITPIVHDKTHPDTIKRAKKLKKAKKGFTVEDVIARNFQELLLQDTEYKVSDVGRVQRTPKTWSKILWNALLLGFSLTNSLIGAGILSLSQTCYKMGIVGFFLWNIATIFYFIITWYFYNKAIYITGAATMGELLSIFFGNVIAIVVDLCNTLFYFCVLMIYQVIITQYLFGIVTDLTSRENFEYTLDTCYEGKTAGVYCKWHYIILYLVALLLNLPLIIPKSVKFLNRISMLSIVGAVTVSFVIFAKAIYYGSNNKSSNGDGTNNVPTFNGKWWPSGVLDFFTMAPFITANYQIHSCLPPLYSGTKGMSKKTKLLSLQGASLVSVVTCASLYILMAISGNVSFDKVSSNVLNDFSNPNSTSVDWLIILSRIFMIIVVTMSFPALMFPTCAGIYRYLPKTWKFTTLWNGRLAILTIRIIILLLTTLFASFLADIGVVFSVASALFSIFVVYICPMSIMMLWPRVEKFGSPEFRKLSVIDNIIYNKVVEGSQKFSSKDIETALNRNEEKGDISDVVLTINTNTSGQQEIELDSLGALKNLVKNENTENKNASKSSENKINIAFDKENTVDVDILKNRNKTIKLPDGKIPLWRYLVFIPAMLICVCLCILSVVGTILNEVKK